MAKEGDKKFLLPRKGCDSVGCFATSGYVEGKKFHYEMEYDIDGDKSTVEPKLVLDGTLEDDNKTIKGEWKQVNEEERTYDMVEDGWCPAWNLQIRKETKGVEDSEE